MADSTRETVEREWANSALLINREAPSDAKQDSGFVAETPPFQWFNWFWRLVTNLLSSSEKNGILPWRSLTSYNQYGLCMGSNGKIYQSVSAANLNHDPVTDSTGTYWKVWVGQAYDEQFVALTSGTLPLTQTANGAYTYDIASFAGSGLVPSEIRAIHVQVKTRGRTTEGYYSVCAVTYPDGTSYTLQDTRDSGGNDSESFTINNMHIVPIEKAQSQITFTTSGGGGYYASFTIIGATQRVFSA